MALQINVPLTTNSGLAVASGSYCWLMVDFGNDFKYQVRCKMLFFKDKAAFDLKQNRIDPVQVPVDQLAQTYTPGQIGAVDYLDIHNLIKAYLESLPGFGPGTVTLVQ
jgi:hypothetical protein